MDARPAARQDSLGSAQRLHSPNPLAVPVTSLSLPAQQSDTDTHTHARTHTQATQIKGKSVCSLQSLAVSAEPQPVLHYTGYTMMMTDVSSLLSFLPYLSLLATLLHSCPPSFTFSSCLPPLLLELSFSSFPFPCFSLPGVTHAFYLCLSPLRSSHTLV